jgi:hypothetical protein
MSYRMVETGGRMKFLLDIMGRADKFSSKKVWYNGACLTVTGCLLWVTYKDSMDDMSYITLYSIYLMCLGGFEVIPKVLGMVLEFKNGRTTTTITATKEETA